MAHALRVVLLWCFVLFFFFLMQNAWVKADDPIAPVYHDCLHNATTSTGLSSTFKNNLNLALRNLTSLAGSTRFATASIGSGPDTVYAMFQCRGDQALSDCSACMRNVTIILPETQCPTFIGARIQVNGCFLRYDSQSFFTPADFEYAAGFCFESSQNSTILKSIQSLLQNVTTTAPKNGGFALASSEGTGEYAMAQCLGYLTESECSECVNLYFSEYATLCPADSLGEQLHLASCYEPYDFFTAAAKVPSLVSTSPSPPEAATPPKQLLAGSTAHSGKMVLHTKMLK